MCHELHFVVQVRFQTTSLGSYVGRSRTGTCSSPSTLRFPSRYDSTKVSPLYSSAQLVLMKDKWAKLGQLQVEILLIQNSGITKIVLCFQHTCTRSKLRVNSVTLSFREVMNNVVHWLAVPMLNAWGSARCHHTVGGVSVFRNR